MNVTKRLILLYTTLECLQIKCVLADISDCLKTANFINPIASDRRIMAYVETSDAEIVQTLSPDHILSGIRVCKDD